MTVATSPFQSLPATPKLEVQKDQDLLQRREQVTHCEGKSCEDRELEEVWNWETGINILRGHLDKDYMFGFFGWSS